MLNVSEDTKRAFITSQIAELEDVLTQAQLQKGSIDPADLSDNLKIKRNVLKRILS